MTRLMLALAGLAALAACSEPRNQDTGRADSIARPLEEALAESSATSTDMAGPPRSAAQERPSQGREQGPHSDVQASPAGQSMAARRLRHPAPALARAATPAPTRPPPARASAPAPAPPGPASAPIPSAGPAPDTVSPPAWVPAPDSTWASDTAGTAARWSQASAAVAGLSLPAGTTIRAALQDSINSRHDSAGQLVMARIREEITDRSGHVVVPAGSPVELSIAQLEPAKSRDASDGKLALQVDSILIDGRAHHVSADVQPVPHELQGRGVTAGEAEKVGVGAAAGAVVGRVLSGNARGAVIGGAVGAVGGVVVAAQTASRDVVVKPGTWVVLVLTAPLVVKE
jgi:hypothetical protein